MQPIIVNGTRILRPHEATALIDGIQKRSHETQLKALLMAGLRYTEAQRFHDHPEWYDNGFIHLPPMAVLKAKRKQKERWVRLNPLGREVVRSFLDNEKPLPSWQTWRENLRRWAVRGGLDPKGCSPKMSRKTWESWLCFYYPNQITHIVLSQGHTLPTAIGHYLNMPFDETDRKDMSEFVGGWL